MPNPSRSTAPPRGGARAAAPARGDLATRTVSALVLAPVVIAAAWWGGVPFLLLLLLVAGLAADEWVRLTAPKGGAALRYGIVAATVAIVAMPFLHPNIRWLAELGLLISGVLALLGLRAARGRGKAAFAALVYVGVPALAIIWLRGRPQDGLELLIYLLAVVWAADIGAYFAGRTLGGPKLAPRISPKKTWSGLIGGALAAAVAGAAVAVAAEAARPLVAALLGAVLAVVGQAGDLFESHMKRRAGVKDSGRIIPGHGGILDRIDGLLAAALVLAAFHYALDAAIGWW